MIKILVLGFGVAMLLGDFWRKAGYKKNGKEDAFVSAVSPTEPDSASTHAQDVSVKTISKSAPIVDVLPDVAQLSTEKEAIGKTRKKNTRLGRSKKAA